MYYLFIYLETPFYALKKSIQTYFRYLNVLMFFFFFFLDSIMLFILKLADD